VLDDDDVAVDLGPNDLDPAVEDDVQVVRVGRPPR
jgi:hypothetical protein